MILIGKSFLDQIVHVPKLFSLLHWSQNIFCFLCSSTPSHGGSFFLKIAIYNGDMAGGISNNRFWAITFDWSDLRTYGQHLRATFLMLFSGIPHLTMFSARSQIAKLAKYLDIWLFGYLAARKKHGQVGYP